MIRPPAPPNTPPPRAGVRLPACCPGRGRTHALSAILAPPDGIAGEAQCAPTRAIRPTVRKKHKMRHMHKSTHACICTYTHMYVRTYVRAYICTCIHLASLDTPVLLRYTPPPWIHLATLDTPLLLRYTSPPWIHLATLDTPLLLRYTSPP